MPLAALLAAVAPQWARLRLDTLTITDDQIVVDLASTAEPRDVQIASAARIVPTVTSCGS